MGHKLSKIAFAVLSGTVMSASPQLKAQEQEAADEVEVIQVSGIRNSLTNALAEKRSANNLVEVIQAIDIGKLPDQEPRGSSGKCNGYSDHP